MTVLPEIFKAKGYATGAFGKWGLGHTNEDGAANPLTHGFDEYYGWKSQTIAHTYYPSSVVHNGREIPLDPGTFVHDQIMERSMDFIERSAKSETPFFCYIPTAVPHAAMHAPKDLHEKWRKRLPEFDAYTGKYYASKDGSETTPDVINPIAGFAAMVENLDNQVGQILQLLDSLGIEENTLVIFTSDNGAHKEGGHDPSFWNSTAGLRGMKRDMHEGGIRTPMLARWPSMIQPGQDSDHISAFWDVMPTMCELIGEPVPEQCDGISFVATLQGSSDEQQQHEHLYFEFCKGNRQEIYSQAVRKGKWKAYLQKKQSMEIFNLQSDPYETNDLASSMPEMVTQMQSIMEASHHSLDSQGK